MRGRQKTICLVTTKDLERVEKRIDEILYLLAKREIVIDRLKEILPNI
jgi:hypothetical protein